MQKTFISILLFVFIIVIFAVQNTQTVLVRFWFWQTDSFLSVVIIVSVTLGAIISYILSIFSRNRKNKKIREQEEKIVFLENEILHLNPESTKNKNEKMDNQ